MYVAVLASDMALLLKLDVVGLLQYDTREIAPTTESQVAKGSVSPCMDGRPKRYDEKLISAIGDRAS